MEVNSLVSPSSFRLNQPETNQSLQPENKEKLDETAKLTEANKEYKEKNKEEDRDLLGNHVESLNKMMEAKYTTLKFNLHEDTNRFYVQVVDQISSKVVREIPQKEFLDMISKMMDYMGLLVDKKA